MILYLDCAGGVAGDMLLAALIDVGASRQALLELPERLGLKGIELKLARVSRHGIGAQKVDVLCPECSPTAGHRSWASIRSQLAHSQLDEVVRERAFAVFSRLADVEGRIHGVSPDDVHFHELGAVDTLIDVVGACTLLTNLGADQVVCSPVPLGRGFVRAEHGMLPLPAPATAALLEGIPIVGVDLDKELVTPTGAALVRTLANTWGPIPPMTLRRVGYGAGTADFPERANLLRLLVGDEDSNEKLPTRAAVLIETNLDDLLPELVPDAMQACYAAGALDVWVTPATMKKGRPGLILGAISRPAAQGHVARAILENSSALGVRVAPINRYELQREQRAVEIDGHVVRVKVGFLDGEIVNLAPEHDDCAEVARLTDRSTKSIWAAAIAAASDLT